MKKMFLGLTLVTIGMTSAVSYVSADSGQGYVSDIATSNQEESFIVTDNPLARLSISAGGGTHEYGVKGIFSYSQYSKYSHNSKTHKTTAMMNDKYTKSSWVAKKVTASAETPKYSSYRTNNSYWDTK